MLMYDYCAAVSLEFRHMLNRTVVMARGPIRPSGPASPFQHTHAYCARPCQASSPAGILPRYK
jgi:hypothetical protein